MHLQRSNDPANPTPIVYDQTLSGNIAIAPEMDVFSFTGTTGDRVIVRMQVTSGTLDPNLRIYNPNGDSLCTASTIFNLLELNCILVTDGVHMIFAHGGDGQIGGYNLYLQRSNDPADPTMIDLRTTVPGTISIAPEMDAFTLNTEIGAGTTLTAQLRVTSSNLDPYLRIYQPDGTLLCQNSTIFDELVLSCNVTITGTYSIFVAGGDNQTGSYELCVYDSSTASCGYQVFLPVTIR